MAIISLCSSFGKVKIRGRVRVRVKVMSKDVFITWPTIRPK